MLAKLRQLFSSSRVRVAPEHEVFDPVDIEKAAAALSVDSNATEDGRDNRPLTDATVLTATEANILIYWRRLWTLHPDLSSPSRTDCGNIPAVAR